MANPPFAGDIKENTIISHYELGKNSAGKWQNKLSIMRSKDNGISPELLLVYIKTRYGQVQIQKFKRGAAQTGLLLEDFDQLFIPVFGNKLQEQIGQLVNQIYKRMQEAVTTYEDAQNYLNDEIGVDVDFPQYISTEKTLSNSFKTTGRLDAEYYQPKYHRTKGSFLKILHTA